MNGTKYTLLFLSIHLGFIILQFSGIWGFEANTYDVLGLLTKNILIVLTAATVGALAAGFFNIRPLTLASIASFGAFAVSIAFQTHLTLSAMALTLDGGTFGMVSLFEAGYMAIIIFILLLTLHQMATGGRKADE